MNDGTNQPPYEQPQQSPGPFQPQYGQPQPPFNQGQYGPPSTQYNPQTSYGQPQPQQPQYEQQYGTPPPGYTPGYAPGYPPAYVPGVQPPPQKRSLRWLWITLAIVGGILVLGCAGCAIAGVFGFNAVKQAVGPAITAQEYYQAIENQDYAKAYSYLDTSSIDTSGQGAAASQSAFVQTGQLLDSTKGKVTKASASAINTNNNTDGTVTMTVTRGGTSYDVHLQLKNINGTWKITGFDNI